MRPCLRLLLTGMTITLLAACSTATGGTAAPSGGVASSVVSAVPTQSPEPSDTASAPNTAAPVITTLTVTATATPATTAPLAPTPASVPAAPGIPPTDLTGEVHGFITAVDVQAGQISVDKVNWFTGAAAAHACAEDGVTSTDNNRCTGYYYRNVNPMLRVVAVSPQASIKTLATNGSLVPSDLTALAARVDNTQASALYEFTVIDGVVTDLREIYFP